MDIQTDSERVRPVAQDGPRVPRLVGRPVARRPDGAGRLDRGVRRALRRRPDAVRAAGRAGRRRRARRARAGHHHAPAGRRGGGDGRPADQGRQRPLRPRLLEVHPLLQVRRGLRRGRPEHVRDRGRRARLRRPDLDRAGRPAARVGLRLLRQLHRRLPDRRADVQVRVRHARGRHLGRVAADRDRHDLPVLRRRLRGRAARPGRHGSSRSPRRSDSSVTDGHLCIKGRFGFEFVNERPPKRDRTGR